MTTVDEALRDPALLGAALGDGRSWSSWLAVLRAAFGLSLSEAELQSFAAVAGGRRPPSARTRELWVVAGRRGGKSRIAAALAVYFAAFVPHRLARGERGLVLCLAASQDQARVVFDYAKAFLTDSPVLRQEIDSITRWEIRLKNGITIAIHANSFRTIRGRTLCACIFDEVAQWRDELSANPDTEVYTSVLPSLLTTKGMLVGISTGYARRGLLYQKHRDYFGSDSADTLVVRGSTLQFNGLLSEADLAAMRAADPAAAPSEWDGSFRDDAVTFLDDALIEQAIEHGRPLELAPFLTYGSYYQAFCDPSGGVGQDSYTVSVAHKEGDNYVIDVCRGTVGRFDPQEVTKQYAELLRQYGCTAITGDSYAGEWVLSAWQQEGITYTKAELPKSQIYLETLPLFARGLVRLPEHPKLLKELRLLERYTHRGGKDTVDHPRGGHDDHANAVCGVLRNLSNYLGYDTSMRWVSGDRSSGDAWYAWRLGNYLRSCGIPW